ncbi:MAG: chromosome segregation SMC family protein [Actinomycetota bacterium]
MHVKSLRLAGFKSFAQPTILELEAGVNVIVGPNGSGKSNIADALTWVLGSQAPSSLRGASMEDVIFAGSEGRPRLGAAEVEITLDNSSRLLPLDLAEVTVGRYADRSGASEYRINGAPCRLLDVAELLSDTGIGRSIHAVVGQGQLDAVLQARPEDRRTFIEEAAQIGKYRRRKDRSLRKIERVDDNLTRLGDVVAELQRALRPLKRQASAASAYSGLVAEHRDLKQRLTATELRRLRSEGSAADPEGDARRAELLAEELAHVRALLEGATEERAMLAQTTEQAQRLAHRTARAADSLAALGRLAEERAGRIEARLAAETEEGYRERIRLLEETKRRWENEADALGAVAQTARADARQARSAADDRAATRVAAEEVVAGARRAETVAAQALVRAEGSEAAGRAGLGSIEARVHATAERRETAHRQIASRAHAVALAEDEVASLEAELDRAVGAASTAEAELEGLRERAERCKDQAASSNAERAAARARVDALEEVRALFADHAGLLGRLDPLLDDARQGAALMELDDEQARGSVIEAEAEVEKMWQEVARHDEEVRRVDALLSGATERLSGARRQRETAEIELVALDDELARGREALASAERDAIEERAQLPARRAALQDVSDALQVAERDLAHARAAETEALDAATRREMDARTAEERVLAAQLRLEEATAGIADAESALAGLKERRAELQHALGRARQIGRIALVAAERGRLWTGRAELRADEMRARTVASEERFAELRTRERELAGSFEEAARARNAAEVRRAEVRTRIEAVGERAMDEWAMSLDEIAALDPLAADDEVAAQERVHRLERQIRSLGAVNPNAAQEYAELAERESFLQAQIEDLKTSRRDLMKVVREVDDTIVEVFAEAYQDVAREFERVFARLFPGGQGRLFLTDPDDLLGSGIEIEARPPGKNVKKMSLLSGGERALVALAFLFSIFRARPSPFYLLDEVEAALDDINLQRFLLLVRELQERAQVLIVTHQKRTMEAADVLYGVSIARDGVSRVVAKRMERVTA